MASDMQKSYIKKIKEFPQILLDNVGKLSEHQLINIYIKNEWTVAQNIHHIADANFNKYNLIRQILTEREPELREFKEELFAGLVDGKDPNINLSLDIIKGLHGRIALLIESLSDQDWQRFGIHPHFGKLTIEAIVETFSTHGERHLAQMRKTLGLTGE